MNEKKVDEMLAAIFRPLHDAKGLTLSTRPVDDHVPGDVRAVFPDGTVVLGEPICDFCTERPVRWSFPLLLTGDAPIDKQWGTWAACDTCHTFVARDDRLALALHTAEKLAALHPHASVEKLALNSLLFHTLFFHSRRNGDPSPFEYKGAL